MVLAPKRSPMFCAKILCKLVGCAKDDFSKVKKGGRGAAHSKCYVSPNFHFLAARLVFALGRCRRPLLFKTCQQFSRLGEVGVHPSALIQSHTFFFHVFAQNPKHSNLHKSGGKIATALKIEYKVKQNTARPLGRKFGRDLFFPQRNGPKRCFRP